MTIASLKSSQKATAVRPEVLASNGHVGELVGIEGGVVSGVINLESSGA